jgi:phosphatidylinositol-3-phosphatase
MENRSYADVIGNRQAPYINSLAQQGLSLTQSFAVTRPSQPNSVALFSGSTRGTTSDACLAPSAAPNLASELSAAGYTFTGYSESLPRVGYTGCSSGAYVRKHNPWASFTNLPASINQPLAAFPTNYNQLP